MTKNKFASYKKAGAVSGVVMASGIALASADATTTATALGTGVGTFSDTLTSVSLSFLTNTTLITAFIIVAMVLGVIGWLKRKVL